MRVIAVLGLLLFAQGAPPKDFSIRMSFASCVGDSFDTASGVFTRHPGTAGPVSARLTLTPADMKELFDAVVEAAFWDLPQTLEPQANADGTVTVTSGGAQFELEVRRDGSSHTVKYNSGVTSEDPRLKRFNDLVARITRVVGARPEVKALPAFQLHCL